MSKIPTVTVVMPSYNVAPYIEGSVRSVIAQTFTDWELLIVDDCSTDDSYDIACRIAETDERIRVLKNEKNSGVARTRNVGIAQAKGKYVALLDSDDQWCETKLEKQLALMKEKKAQVCYTSYEMVSDKGEKVHNDFIVPPETNFKKMLVANVIGCSMVMLDTEVAQKHPFNESFYHEDYVLWLDLLRDGCRAVGCTEILARYCIRGDSRSAKKASSAKNRWLIYRKHLKMNVFSASYYLMRYAIAGLKKYAKK